MMIHQKKLGLGQGSTAADIIDQYQEEFANNNPFILNNPSLAQGADAQITDALNEYCANNPTDTSSCSGSSPLPQYTQEANQIASSISAPLAAAAAAGQTTPIATPGTTTANNPGPVETIADENCLPGQTWGGSLVGCMNAPAPSTPVPSAPITAPSIPVSGPVSIQPTQTQMNAPVTGASSSTSTAVTASSGFEVPAWLTETSIDGIQNWALLAAGLAALLILPSFLGGRR
jgi:hypothetical protein